MKRRIRQLESVGFTWEAPANPDDGGMIEKRKAEKEKAQIKHNLLAAVSKYGMEREAGNQSSGRGDTSSCFLTNPTEDFYEHEVVTRVPVQQTQSLRGRRRMPSRRMQESYNANLQNESIEEKVTSQKRKYDDDVSTVTSFGSSHGASKHLKVSSSGGGERPASVVVKRSLQETQQGKPKQRKIGRGKQLIGDENDCVKRGKLCHREGCYKFKASYCAGYCVTHFNEINGINNNTRGPYKTKKKTVPPKEKHVSKPTRVLPSRDKPKDVPPKEKPVSKPTRVLPSRDKFKDVPLEENGPASPEREMPQRKAKPEFLSSSSPSKKIKEKTVPETPSGRDNPIPSEPRSCQNEYGFPTGQNLIHPPTDPAPEFGDGWTTRTLPRISTSKGSKNSDTYFYSPLVRDHVSALKRT